MRYDLLPRKGKFYKANLHCHSTISDGNNTPIEMKEYYKAKGYSILAITDHELLVDHSDMSDSDFLMLTGYEVGFLEHNGKSYQYRRNVDLNLIAKEPHNVTHVCFHPRYVYHGEKWRIDSIKKTKELFEREYTISCMQELIDEARNNGFLVCLNHPHYSFESPAFFGELQGLWAMEIHNQSSLHYGDYNPHMYDQMLRMGHRIPCIAADDNHRAYVYDDTEDKRPWGCTMIKTENLTYESVIHALEAGDFYATQGPEITELFVEDGKVYIACSEAKTIVMHTKYRHYGLREAECRKSLTEAEFQVPADDEYMRFTVIDAYGRHATTRAYFLDEFQ